MVLICNNNVLTIDTFHKHRCEEKNEIRNIIVNRKYIREKYKETEPVEETPTRSLTEFLASVELLDVKSTRAILINRR